MDKDTPSLGCEGELRNEEPTHEDVGKNAEHPSKPSLKETIDSAKERFDEMPEWMKKTAHFEGSERGRASEPSLREKAKELADEEFRRRAEEAVERIEATEKAQQSITRMGVPVTEPEQINRPFDYVPNDDEFNRIKVARLHNSLPNRADKMYMKRIYPVAAVQVTLDTWAELCSFCGLGELKEGRPQAVCIEDGKIVDPKVAKKPFTYGIAFPHNNPMLAKTGMPGQVAVMDDYIVRNSDGAFYVFKADYFEKVFVEVS